MSSIFEQKELLYEEDMSFTTESNKTNYNESIIKYIYFWRKSVKKRSCSSNYVISLWAKKSQSRLTNVWDLRELPPLRFAGSSSLWSQTIFEVSFEFCLFVCLIEGSGTKGHLAFPQVNWQMCEIYEGSRHCVLLEAHHYGAKQFLKYHLNLFVCLIKGSGTKGHIAIPLIKWQMGEICVLLEAHHNVARTALKSKLHFCILFRLFPHTNVAILINITDTTQIQSKSWFWPHCVLTHTK